MSDVVTLHEAAREVGLSRRRLNALVASGQIPAVRAGHMWVIDRGEFRVAVRNLQGARGRPISRRAAWGEIVSSNVPKGAESRDRFRRRLRTRAEHQSLFVHSGLLEKLRSDEIVFLSGRDAAQAMGVPVSPSGLVHAYVHPDELQGFRSTYRPRMVAYAQANLILHVSEVIERWEDNEKFVHPVAVWLDLEDDQDRSARFVLDESRLGSARLG